MELHIVASANDARIETCDKQSPTAFVFYRRRDAYTTGDGVGCQVNDESLRAQIEGLCMELSTAVMNFELAKETASV